MSCTRFNRASGHQLRFLKYPQWDSQCEKEKFAELGVLKINLNKLHCPVYKMSSQVFANFQFSMN